MKIKYYFIVTILFFSGMFTACYDLDLPPLNIIQDKDLLSSEEGMEFYLSRMYSLMPFDDFKWSTRYGYGKDYIGGLGGMEGASIQRDLAQTFTSEGWGTDWGNSRPYWVNAYTLLRDANRLLETLPDYKSGFTDSRYNHFIGEAYFARAMVYYNMAKRYGGVPIVLEVLKYPENSADALEVPRSTEEETWNQVLADFDEAIARLEETSPKRGYANKYVALGFKSEAMLFAGSVAKYNTTTGFGQKTGVRVIGFDPNTAAAASRKYFREAYNAAREVMRSNRYSLYLRKAGNPQAQFENMVDMFFDVASSENLYIKEYYYPNMVHGFDTYNIPRQLVGAGQNSQTAPVLDFVELFDGFDKNPDGTIKVFDDNGKYLLFDHPMDIFRNVEPRLRAYVILPYDIFKGEEIEIRRGTYTGDVTNGIPPLMVNLNTGETDYSFANMIYYFSMPTYTGTGPGSFGEKVLYLDVNQTTREIVTLDDGSQMFASAINGPHSVNPEAAIFGFHLRKYMVPDKPRSEVAEGRSTQHFVLMRYGEILLNVAEAACELSLAGESAPAGDNFEDIATNAIVDIRARAGADPLVGMLTLNEDGLKVIRKERRKELAFEHKVLWDIRRWRTHHSDNNYAYGFTHSDPGVYYRALFPFYSTKANKYFFDARIDELRWYLQRFMENQYYFAIPGGEVSKSDFIDQQPNR